MEKSEAKNKFEEDKFRYKGPNKLIIASTLFVILAVIGVFYVKSSNSNQIVSRYEGGDYRLNETFEYENSPISMTNIKSEIAGDKIKISLDKIKKNKLVYIDVKGTDNALTAFITNAGRLVVAVAMCEPCRSTRFRIEEYNLVCETCGTRWNLNDLTGLSGGCPQYAPEGLPYKVKDNYVYVDKQVVYEWRPRM